MGSLAARARKTNKEWKAFMSNRCYFTIGAEADAITKAAIQQEVDRLVCKDENGRLWIPGARDFTCLVHQRNAEYVERYPQIVLDGECPGTVPDILCVYLAARFPQATITVEWDDVYCGGSFRFYDGRRTTIDEYDLVTVGDEQCCSPSRPSGSLPMP